MRCRKDCIAALLAQDVGCVVFMWKGKRLGALEQFFEVTKILSDNI